MEAQLVNVSDAKFLMAGVIIALSAFLIYDLVATEPVITFYDEPIAQPEVNINLSKEPESGKISGILSGPTIINITALNTTK